MVLEEVLDQISKIVEAPILIIEVTIIPVVVIILQVLMGVVEILPQSYVSCAVLRAILHLRVVN